MAFHQADADKAIEDPSPGKATYALEGNQLGVLRLAPADVPGALRALRLRLKACAWADGSDPADLLDAHRACVLAIELAETARAGDPRMSWLSREDVDLLYSVQDPGTDCMWNALNWLRGRCRPAGAAGPVEADRMAKSVGDLFTC